jgi:hypothetical protein
VRKERHTAGYVFGCLDRKLYLLVSRLITLVGTVMSRGFGFSTRDRGDRLMSRFVLGFDFDLRGDGVIVCL